MDIDAWFTVAVIVICFLIMASNRVPPDITLMGGLSLLLVSGILTPELALAGFANEGMITVAILFVVVTGLRDTGAIAWLGQAILGKPKSLISAQLRVMLPVAGMSAFLNNTPVVAMFIPAINDWANKNKLSVSKLMMPLSYAAIVGGTCTLIGTSTNLVLNGLLINETDSSGIGMFDLVWIGLPLSILTFFYVLFFSKFLLPERKPAISQFEDVRQYTVEMIVEPKSALSGKTIEDAGLRQLPGLYLIEIERQGRLLPAVSPQETLQTNDRLIFAGILESVVDLRKIRGLIPATDQISKLEVSHTERCLVEAVVSNRCPLVGRSIREGRFRTNYNAAIIALARDGRQIKKKIGDIVLLPGDTLLMETHPSFINQQKNSRDFYLVSQLEDATPPQHEKALLSMIILSAMVLSVAFGLLSMLKAALLAAGLMIITRCTRGRAARRAIDWQVLIVIAASFAIGNALQVTGAASVIAENLIALAAGSSIVALVIIFVCTSVFTALATNNTAAVLMFPIALSAAQQLECNFLPFAVTIMIGASASFATPIGYQTNLMVYGPGGYRFSDYIRFGTPLTFLIGGATVAIVPIVWPL